MGRNCDLPFESKYCQPSAMYLCCVNCLRWFRRIDGFHQIPLGSSHALSQKSEAGEVRLVLIGFDPTLMAAVAEAGEVRLLLIPV